MTEQPAPWSLNALHTYYLVVLYLHESIPSFFLMFDLAGHSNYTSLVIRKNSEGEVRLAIPLYYLCVVDKYTIDKKTYGEFSAHCLCVIKLLFFQ